MPFLAYFAVMIVAVGSVLFGLEVITSLPHKPASQVVGTMNKLAQHKADQRAAKIEGDASRPLAPLYPVTPGGAKDVRVVYPPGDQKAATKTTDAAPVNEHNVEQAAEPKEAKTAQVEQAQRKQAQLEQPKQQDPSMPQPLQKPQLVKGDGQSKPAQAAARDATVQAQNDCDVPACASAYSSFRATDCTYQPFEGPRRACTAPPAPRSAERGRPHYSARAQVTQTQQQLRRRATDPADVAMNQDDDDDATALVGTGRRVIIFDRNYRPWY
jgi:hypothetical protein